MPGATALPARDPYLSPQHRVLLRLKIAARMFGTSDLRVPAIKLRTPPSVDQVLPDGPVAYHHFLCPRHEIVRAEQLPCETLLRAEQSVLSLSDQARKAWALLCGAGLGPVRPISVRGGRVERPIDRHLKNGKPLIGA